MENKENKKEKQGFWASLFKPKQCSCCCDSMIEELKEEALKQIEANKEKENESKNTPSCECGGNC